MNIEQIKLLCIDKSIEVTSHILQRMAQRGITYSEIKDVVLNGEIIEEYPCDFPYPSCLVMGFTIKSRVLHVVLGIGDSRLWLITAYEPDPKLWDDKFRKRKDL